MSHPAVEALRTTHQLSAAEYGAIREFLTTALQFQDTPEKVAKWLHLVEDLSQDLDYLLHLAGYETAMWELEDYPEPAELTPVTEDTALMVVQSAASVSRLLPDALVQKLFGWLPGQAPHREDGFLTKYMRLSHCFQSVCKLSQHNAEALLDELLELPHTDTTLAIATAW